MLKFFNSLLTFLKKEFVLTAAWILAIISMFFVHPDKEYFSYIDWRSLGILWSLMVIINVFASMGIFNRIAASILKTQKSTFQLLSILTALCFFLSMLITNDVSLITFVPFTILLLKQNPRLLIPAIVLETLAANLGSMLTPVGNPQNLYLFSFAAFSLKDFITLLLPYSLLSLALLFAAILIICSWNKKRHPESNLLSAQENSQDQENGNIFIPFVIIFAALFIVTIVWVVFHIEGVWKIALPILFLTLIINRKSLLKVDYCLLLTFIGFFIFTGNMQRVPAINSFLKNFVAGKELWCGIISSQIISNVPACLLLSKFSADLKALTVGVNLGGLGTLIASMASLISYKFYAKTEGSHPGKYLLFFTGANLIFLAALILLSLFIS